jgi:protocatechuate 4,5-dioxygenase alpha chain
MSRHAVERALWLLSTDRSAKDKFREDPKRFLSRFQLTEEEESQITSFDVKAMQASGVNPMLTMGYWQEMSPTRNMRDYVKALRGGKEGSGPVHSAALKGDQ